MQHPPKILIVEDEMVIAANISLELTKLGYDVTGIIPRGEEALVHMKENTPDIILMDLQMPYPDVQRTANRSGHSGQRYVPAVDPASEQFA